MLSHNSTLHCRWSDQGVDDCLSVYYFSQSQEAGAQEVGEVDVPACSGRVRRLEEGAGTGTHVVGGRKDQGEDSLYYMAAEGVEQGAWGQA